MRRIASVVLAILGIALFSPVVQAEDAPPQTLVGRRVRVMMTNASGKTDRLVANVVAQDEHSLTLVREGAEDSRVTVQLSTVTRLERSVAKGRRGRGAALGLLIGGVAGALLGYATANDDPLFQSERGGWAIAGGVMFGALGAGIGAVVSPGEQWERVRYDGVHVGIGPIGGRGFGVQWSISF